MFIIFIFLSELFGFFSYVVEVGLLVGVISIGTVGLFKIFLSLSLLIYPEMYFFSKLFKYLNPGVFLLADSGVLGDFFKTDGLVGVGGPTDISVGMNDLSRKLFLSSSLSSAFFLT